MEGTMDIAQDVIREQRRMAGGKLRGTIITLTGRH